LAILIIIQLNNTGLSMMTNNAKNFNQLEDWLTILINTYSIQPSTSLAKIISYQLNQLILDDELKFIIDKRCEYIAMQKYWRWVSLL